MDLPQRRRKLATYGKVSRTTNYAFHNDIASPEKPRVAKASWTGGAEQRNTSEEQGTGSERSQAPSFGIFDVPSSDDEPGSPSKTPAKIRPVARTQTATATGKLSGQSGEDSASEQLLNEAAAAVVRLPPKQPDASETKYVPKPLEKKLQMNTVLSRNIQKTIFTNQRRKVPTTSIVPDAKSDASKSRRFKRSHSVTEPSADEIETTSAAEERPHKSLKSKRHVSQSKESANITSKPSLAPTGNKTEISKQTAMRKPISVPAATPNPAQDQPTRLATKSENAKSSNALPDRPRVAVSSASTTANAEKPRRTYGKSTSARAQVRKGKSAPALLHNMLSSPESKPSSPPETMAPRMAPSALDGADVNIDLPSTPPKKTSPSPFKTVTPRQSQAWSKLLDETATSSPSQLNLDDLQLQTVKPRRTQLLRSGSDVTETTRSPRARLIDTLKQNAPTNKNEDEDEDDEDETILDTNDFLAKRTVASNTPSKAETIQHTPLTDSQAAGTAEGLSQDVGSSQTTSVTAGPKLTYARTRSYLNEDSLEDILNMPLPMDISPLKGGPRRNKMLGYGGNTQEEDLEDSQGGIRNIHELRAAGGARRMVDDIENLIDDIEEKKANSMSRRRSALLELCSKLIDKAYVGRMVDHGLDYRLFAICAATTDPVLGFGTASAITFIVLAEAPPTALNMIYQSGCLRTLVPLLKHDADINRIAKDRKTNMSKIARDSLAEFRALVGSTIWPEETPKVVSPRLISLKSMELLVRKLRENGNKEELLGYGPFADVALIAKIPTEALVAGSATSADIAHLEVILSILESASINATTWINSGLDPTRSISQLVDTVKNILCSDTSTSEHLEPLALRLTLNLTNNNPRICEVFSSPPLVQAMVRSIDSRCQALQSHLDEEEHMKTLDRLILSLGTMINLAEFSDRARTSIISDHDELIHSLVRSFVTGMAKAEQADSMEESQTSVAYGYLAVLLGNICRNTQMKEKIRSQLPNKRMDVLIRAVEEFIYVHQKVDSETFTDGDEGREVWANYTARLQGVIQRLKQSEFD